MASKQLYNTPLLFYMTLKMPIYWTAKGLSDIQTPLRPPMDNQKSFKLHICILWSHVVTLKAITGLSLISFIYGTPPKSAPARKCRKNPDLLGDLWPRRKEFTTMKLCQIVNLSLIHLWTKFGFGVSSPSWWDSVHKYAHFAHFHAMQAAILEYFVFYWALSRAFTTRCRSRIGFLGRL